MIHKEPPPEHIPLRLPASHGSSRQAPLTASPTSTSLLNYLSLDQVQGDGDMVRAISCPFPPISQHIFYHHLTLYLWPPLPSFLVLEESLCAGKPPGFSSSLSTFRKTRSPPFSFPECGSSPADSNLKTGSPWGQCHKWSWGSDRRWAWGKHFLNALPAPWPCPGLMAFISPWRLSWNHSH